MKTNEKINENLLSFSCCIVVCVKNKKPVDLKNLEELKMVNDWNNYILKYDYLLLLKDLENLIYKDITCYDSFVLELNKLYQINIGKLYEKDIL